MVDWRSKAQWYFNAGFEPATRIEVGCNINIVSFLLGSRTVRSSASDERGHTECESAPTYVKMLLYSPLALCEAPSLLCSRSIFPILGLPVLAYNGCDLHLLPPTLSDTSSNVQLVLAIVSRTQQPANLRLSPGYYNSRRLWRRAGVDLR